jgi:hypothetical protein
MRMRNLGKMRIGLNRQKYYIGCMEYNYLVVHVAVVKAVVMITACCEGT